MISRSGRARIASTPSPPPIKWLPGNVCSGDHAAAHVPAELRAIAKASIDFEYPSQVSVFSLRDGNLLMIAHDQNDTSRTRLVISAQLNKATRIYIGQIVRDDGGNERQLINGPVSCSVK